MVLLVYHPTIATSPAIFTIVPNNGFHVAFHGCHAAYGVCHFAFYGCCVPLSGWFVFVAFVWCHVASDDWYVTCVACPGTGSDFLHSLNIYNFTDCTVIHGDIRILHSSFDG